MLEFPTIDPDAERILTFVFSQELLPGEVLAGGPTVINRVTAGTDSNPAAIMIGPPSYGPDGTTITQPVGNLGALDGNDYEFEAISLTTFPDRRLVIRAILPVRSA